VTDSHSHGWVEVFFPQYGWIPFEPTPGEVLPGKFIPSPLVESSVPLNETTDDDLDEDCLDDFDLFDDCVFGNTSGSSDGAFPGSSLFSQTVRDALPWILAVMTAVGVTAVIAKVLWWRFMEPSTNPGTMYRRLAFLGALNSVSATNHQTPYQYRSRLEEVWPDQRDNLSAVIGSYVRSLYGKKDLSDGEQEQLVQAWLKLRIPMLLNVVRRRN